jgi:hypothetical protein
MYKVLCGILIIGMFSLSPARGQDNSNQPVSRQEFEQLKKDNAEMKQELAALKKQTTEQVTNNDQDAQDFDKQLKALKQELDKGHPGLESIVIAGDSAVGFTTQRKTDSSFNADVSPLILWQPPDSKFLVEFAFDLAIGGADVNSQNTTATVNLADISYDVCDFFTVGGGLFAVPFGQFHNHFDPPWINKFPDNPLAFDAIAPVSEVGFFAKGAIPSGTTKWTYDVYAANGANLITDDPNAAGQLNFNDYTDINNNKAVGGRIGFLPFPDIEMGYSLQFSDPNPHGFNTVHAFLQAADFHWKPIINAASGQFDLAGEWIWSSLGTNTYDPTGALGFGPTTFNNYRQGGYVSLGYRPTQVDNKFLRNLEFLGRYDTLQSNLSSPGGEHESRWTLGIDYWVTPYCVIKGAYEIDQKKVGPDQNALIVQVGFGL